MYIRGIGAYIPNQRITTQYAVAHYGYPIAYMSKDDYVSVAIEPKLFPPQMAEIASRAALRDARIDGSEIKNLIYASIHWQGYERIWNPASYLQNQLALYETLPLNIQHGCNGGFLALQQIFKQTEPNHQLLLVSADNFTHSSFSRWNADYGLIYGDAAVSTLFDSNRGFAKVIFFQTKTIPELETLHRLDDPHCENEVSWKQDYDIKATKKHFLQKKSHEAFTYPILFCLESIKDQLIEQIKPKKGSISWLVTPFVGDSVRLSTYEKIFGPLCQRSFWSEGKKIGHTGASDALLGVYMLLNGNQVKIGDQILLVSAGAGFTCSVMLIEITPEFIKKRKSNA
ncbi:ketoacyl-ACP synthase III family protein [Vibrio mimicus]